MNFALMFALALGIDYALFIVTGSAPPFSAAVSRSTRSPRRWTRRARRCCSAA